MRPLVARFCTQRLTYLALTFRVWEAQYLRQVIYFYCTSSLSPVPLTLSVTQHISISDLSFTAFLPSNSVLPFKYTLLLFSFFSFSYLKNLLIPVSWVDVFLVWSLSRSQSSRISSWIHCVYTCVFKPFIVKYSFQVSPKNLRLFTDVVNVSRCRMISFFIFNYCR